MSFTVPSPLHFLQRSFQPHNTNFIMGCCVCVDAVSSVLLLIHLFLFGIRTLCCFSACDLIKRQFTHDASRRLPWIYGFACCWMYTLLSVVSFLHFKWKNSFVLQDKRHLTLLLADDCVGEGVTVCVFRLFSVHTVRCWHCLCARCLLFHKFMDFLVNSLFVSGKQQRIHAKDMLSRTL